MIIGLYANSNCIFNLIFVSYMSNKQVGSPGSGWLPALSTPGKA